MNEEENQKIILPEQNVYNEQLIKVTRIFSDLRYIILDYLKYLKQGLITEEIHNLKVIETRYGICIANLEEGKTISTITFAKESIEEYPLLLIQTLTSEDTLEYPKTIRLVPNSYEHLQAVVKLPNEAQINAIIATKKKVDEVIVPLTIQGWKKYISLPIETQRKLKKNN